jgi:deoxyadenosine/deoxycytidine kinase
MQGYVGARKTNIVTGGVGAHVHNFHMVESEDWAEGNGFCRLVFVEGGIGAGKSTVISSIAEALAVEYAKHYKHRKRDLSVVVVPEPVELWKEMGVLEKMYKREMSACEFQHIALGTRTDQLCNVKRALEEQVCLSDDLFLVVERGIDADPYLFAPLYLTSDEYGRFQDMHAKVHATAWQNLFAQFERTAANKDGGVLLVYLRVDSDVMMARIVKRARAGETRINVALVQALTAGHETYFEYAHAESIRSKADEDRRLSKMPRISESIRAKFAPPDEKRRQDIAAVCADSALLRLDGPAYGPPKVSMRFDVAMAYDNNPDEAMPTQHGGESAATSIAKALMPSSRA